MNVNLRLVSRHLALLMFVLSGLILLVGLFSLVEHWVGTSTAQGEIAGLLLSAVSGAAIGGLLLWLGKRIGPLFNGQTAQPPHIKKT